MVKLREARYCNLKLLLIFLVIYGHLIEPQIWTNANLMVQYRWIYLVHMPLFSFLSGLFIKGSNSCVAQLRRVLPIYISLQTAAVLFGNGAIHLLTPCWHLWYLLSYSFWLGLAWLWFRFAEGKRKILILILSLLAGCLVGYVSSIGRVFSLSRTIVFFPYFWLGIICDRRCSWEKYRIAGTAALLISIFVMYLFGDEIKITFLYQAEPFGIIKNGIALRLLCYLLGILLGFFLLTFIPNRRYCFTKAGVNTLPAYILHAPAVILLRQLNWSCLIYAAVSAGILWLIYKSFQWHGSMYGITVPERRRG